jgi:hypothetical protein
MAKSKIVKNKPVAENRLAETWSGEYIFFWSKYLLPKKSLNSEISFFKSQTNSLALRYGYIHVGDIVWDQKKKKSLNAN